ncbi:hypothetical protein AALB16_05645 [Lachnospiraceae bacterium 62-35]
MEYNGMLKKAAVQAKGGITEGFENLYILTYQEIYQSILECGQDKDQAERILETFYVLVYNRIKEVPDDSSDIIEWLKELLYGLGISEEEKKENFEIIGTLSEEKAATIFLRIEEQTGILCQEDKEDLSQKREKYLGEKNYSFFKIMLSVALSVSVVVFVLGGLWTKNPNILKDVDKEITDANLAYVSQFTETQIVYETEEETISIHLADQVFMMGIDGKLLSSKREEEKYHPSIQENSDFTYYLLQGGEIPEPMRGTLLRIYENNQEQYEIIDENVKDYIVEDNIIYYVKDGMIEKKETGINFGKHNFSYRLAEIEDGFYMINELGEKAPESLKAFEKDGMIYHLKSGYVQSAEKVQCSSNGISYILADGDEDGKNEICWQSGTDSGILVKGGYWIDSFCLADGWIYYSVFEGMNPEYMRYSRIYRIRPDGTYQEPITETFQGIIINMYYSEENKKIYGEFMPDVYNRYYGRLAAISLNGQLGIVDDSIQRAAYQTSGNDILKFVGVEENKIFCYWYDCQWTRGEDARVVWTKPIILYD